MKEIERKIFSVPFMGISLNTFIKNKNLKKDIDAEQKVSLFLNYIQWFYNDKKKFDIKNNSNIYFNLLLARSSYKSMFFTLEKKKEKYYLKYFISNNSEEIAKPFQTKMIEIKENEFQNFINLLTNKNIQNSSIGVKRGYDGTIWFLESKFENSHTLKEIWSPNINCKSSIPECSMIKACLYLIKLSKLKTISEDKINYNNFKYDPNEPEGYIIK